MFKLRSFPEIISSMISEFIANTSVTDLNKGSVITTFLEAAANEDFRQYFAMLDIINSYSINTVEGEDLDKRASEVGITRLSSSKSSGFVTIEDRSFTKISTRIHAGLAGPLAGQNIVYVDDASNFPASGFIIIGRGNANVEKISYTSITIGTVYSIVNLGSNLSNDHGVNESVIFSQGGNREIPAGTIVKIPATDYSEEVSFSVDVLSTILDGETILEGIPITALQDGTDSNSPTRAINLFDSPPFDGAIVYNPSSLINGRDLETDDSLRDRIKDTIQSLSRGTSKSILTGVVGVIDPDTNKRVVSANLIDNVDPTDSSKLYIDDGTGFEASFLNRGLETIVRSSTGGEQFIQLDHFPLVKANILSINSQPFNIPHNSTLILTIGKSEETLYFYNDDFSIPGSGSSDECVSAINNRSALVEARTYDGGKRVEIRSKRNTNEYIQILGGTSNTQDGFNFPLLPVQTLYLYQYDGNSIKLLSKDGDTASIECSSTSPYDFSSSILDLYINEDGETEVSLRECSVGSSGETIVDSTIDLFYPQTGMLIGKYIRFDTGNNIDIAAKIIDYDANLKTIVLESGVLVSSIAPGDVYSILKVTRVLFNNQSNKDFEVPSSAFPSEICTVINNYIKDISSPSSDNTKIKLISKIKNSSLSRIRVLGGSANSILNFDTQEVEGSDRDFILNRFNGQIELSTPLPSRVSITSGSNLTRAFLVGNLSQLYPLVDGDTLIVRVDRGIDQTIVFNNDDFADIGNSTSDETCSVINSTLKGGFSESTDDKKIKITSNTFDNSNSFIEIIGGTSYSKFGFSLGVESSALIPHKSFLISQTEENYNFIEGDNLVVILDQDIQNKAFNIFLSLEGEILNPGVIPNLEFTSIISATGQLFSSRFLNNSDLVDFKVIWKTSTGGNTGEVSYISSYDIATNKITLVDPLPGNIMPGDTFVIIPITASNVSIFIGNTVVSTLSTLSKIDVCYSGKNVQITTNQNGSDGSVNVSGGTANNLSALLTQDSNVQSVNIETSTFKVGMDVIVKDNLGSSTVRSVVGVIPNSPTEGIYEVVLDGPADLDSYLVSRGAYIYRVNILNFPLVPSVGIDGYRYYTGLLKRVQNIVDGLDSDSGTYSGIRASGVQVEVLGPTRQILEFTIDVSLSEGVSISQISDIIKGLVVSYVNSLGVGEDVILTEIVEKIMNVDGIKDVDIISPSENIAIADGEVARTSENQIIIG